MALAERLKKLFFGKETSELKDKSGFVITQNDETSPVLIGEKIIIGKEEKGKATLCFDKEHEMSLHVIRSNPFSTTVYKWTPLKGEVRDRFSSKGFYSKFSVKVSGQKIVFDGKSNLLTISGYNSITMKVGD